MTIELNLTNLIFILFTLVGAFWALVKVIIYQSEKSLDERFSALSATIAADQKATRELERELLRFQGELPRFYLRREDYVREVQVLQEAMQRDILPIRQSLTRIEDFLLTK